MHRIFKKFATFNKKGAIPMQKIVLKYDIDYNQYNFDIAKCKKSADSGYDVALYNLGCSYQNGIHVQKDTEQAKWCFEKIAEVAHFTPLYLTQKFYHTGIDIPQGLQKYEHWFSKESGVKDYDAKDYLGFYYIFYYSAGFASKEYYERGFNFLVDLAKRGDAFARACLLIYSENKLLDAADDKGYYFYLQESAKNTKEEQNDALQVVYKLVNLEGADRAYLSARCYEQNKDAGLPDAQKERRCYIKAEEVGSANAALDNGVYFFNNNDGENAIKSLQKAVDAGVPGATFYLAQCYEYGIGATKDVARAYGLYNEACKMAGVDLNICECAKRKIDDLQGVIKEMERIEALGMTAYYKRLSAIEAAFNAKLGELSRSVKAAPELQTQSVDDA